MRANTPRRGAFRGADVACRDLQIEAQAVLLAVIVPQQAALRIPIDLELNNERTMRNLVCVRGDLEF